MSKKRIAFHIVLILILIAVLWIGYRGWLRQRPDYYWEKAQAALQAGDNQAARLYLQNLVKRAAQDARGHQALAELYLREAQAAGKPATLAANPRALGHLAEAARLRPHDVDLQRRLLAIYLSMGQMQNAADIAATVVTLDPDSSNALFALAWQAVTTKNVSRADELLQELNELPSRQVFQASQLHIQNHENAGRRDEIPRVLDHATELARSLTAEDFGQLSASDVRMMPKLLLQAVQAAENTTVRQQRADNSLRAFETLLGSKRMKSGELARCAAEMMNLVQSAQPLESDSGANISTRDELTRRAERICMAAIAAGDAPPVAYHYASTAAFMRGEYEAATNTLNAGLQSVSRLSQTHPAAVLDLHLLAVRQSIARRRFSEAERHLQVLLNDTSTAGLGHLYAGSVALEEGRLEQALDHYLNAQRSLGNTLQVRVALANAFLATRRWGDALPILASLHVSFADLPPLERAWAEQHLVSDEYVHLNELRACLALGRWKQALPHLEALKDSEFETPAWQLAVVYLWENDHTSQARALLADARGKFPTNLGLLRLEVAILRQSGRVDEARELLVRFASMAPADLETQVTLCEWRIRDGQSAEALQQLEDLAALSKAPRDRLLVTLCQVQALLTQGRPKEALAVVEPLRADPNTAVAAGVIGAAAQVQQQNLEAAALQLNSALQANPRSGVLSLLAGELAATQGDFNRAIAAMTSSLDVTSLRERARRALLRSLLMLADQSGAAEVATKVESLLQQYPDDPYLFVARAEMNLRQGDPQGAMEALDHVERLRPEGPLGAYLKASAWQRQHNVDRALLEVKRALQLRPEHLPSLALATRVSLMAKQDTAALRYAERALQLSPNLWYVALLRAEALQRLDRPDEAINVIKGVIQARSTLPYGYLALAEAYGRSGQTSKAYAVFREGHRRVIEPFKFGLINAEVGMLARSGKLEQARQLAIEAMAETPEAEQCLMLAQTFFSANELAEAVQWGRKVLELANERQGVDAHLLLGQIALAQCEVTADAKLLAVARDHFAVVHELAPTNVVAANNLAWLLATEFNQAVKAVKVCEVARGTANVRQLGSDFIDTAAVVYRQAGRSGEALELLREALIDRPQEGNLRFQLGLTLAAQKRDAAAAEALQTALKLGLPSKRATEARRLLASLSNAEP